MPNKINAGCIHWNAPGFGLLWGEIVLGTFEQVQVVVARHILIEVFANTLGMSHLPGRLKLGDLAIFNKKIYI